MNLTINLETQHRMTKYILVCSINGESISALEFDSRKIAIDSAETIIDKLGFNPDPNESKLGQWILEDSGVTFSFKLLSFSDEDIKYWLRTIESGKKVVTRQFSSRSVAVRYAVKYLDEAGFDADKIEADAGEWSADNDGNVVNLRLSLVTKVLAEDNDYKTIGLRSDATKDEIKRAYRTRAQQVHPDHGGSENAMRELKEAYDRILSSNGTHVKATQSEYYSVSMDFMLGAFILVQKAHSQDSAQTRTQTQVNSVQNPHVGGGQVIGGIVLLVIGGAITSLSYSATNPGGTYVVTTGLFIFGAYNFIKGLVNLARGK